MDKLEKYTKRILNKKPVALSPIAFNIDEANAEIDIAEKELSEGKGNQRNGEPAFANRTKQYRSLVEGYYKIIYTMRKRSHDTSRFIMGLPSEPRQAQKTIRQI